MKRFIVTLIITLLFAVSGIIEFASTTCFDKDDYDIAEGTCDNQAQCGDDIAVTEWTCCIEASPGEDTCNENWGWNANYVVHDGTQCNPNPCYFWQDTDNVCKGGSYVSDTEYVGFHETDTVTGTPCS